MLILWLFADAKLENSILLSLAAKSLMQMIVYFSTLEIHDGSTACEISISRHMDGSRVLMGTQRLLIHFNCDITYSSILNQVYALSCSHP